MLPRRLFEFMRIDSWTASVLILELAGQQIFWCGAGPHLDLLVDDVLGTSGGGAPSKHQYQWWKRGPDQPISPDGSQSRRTRTACAF